MSFNWDDFWDNILIICIATICAMIIFTVIARCIYAYYGMGYGLVSDVQTSVHTILMLQ